MGNKSDTFTSNKAHNEMFRILIDLYKERFYGELILKFENGQIVHMRKTENIKLR